MGHPVELIELLLESSPHLEYHIGDSTLEDACPVEVVPHLGVILCIRGQLLSRLREQKVEDGLPLTVGYHFPLAIAEISCEVTILVRVGCNMEASVRIEDNMRFSVPP